MPFFLLSRQILYNNKISSSGSFVYTQPMLTSLKSHFPRCVQNDVRNETKVAFPWLFWAKNKDGCLITRFYVRIAERQNFSEWWKRTREGHTSCKFARYKSGGQRSAYIPSVRMCPLYPFHVIILYLCLLLPLLFAIVEGADELAGLKVPKWNVSFLPSKVEKLQEKNFTEVKFTCQSCPLTDHDPGSLQLLLKNDQPDIAAIEFEVIFL